MHLKGYALWTRYPLALKEITEQDMKVALKNANEILEFTKARIDELGFNCEV